MIWNVCPASTIIATCIAPLPLSIFTSPPVVDLGYAKYRGIVLDSGVSQYLGIRYAAAPIGNLRFRAPVSPPVVAGLQSATSVDLLQLFVS
jgi:acetylcholinesterase